MGQVPLSKQKSPYLLIGNGRLAKHFKYYLELQTIPYHHWWRNSGFDLDKLLSQSSKILVLISDDAIEPFVKTHRSKAINATWIHCSGSLETPLAEGAHPLMTFGDRLYDLHTYQSMPFVTTSGRKCFKELFPELINPSQAISQEKKTLYHAWASMAGNFSSMLWTEYFQRLEQEFQIDRNLAAPYMNQIFKNISSNQNPMTGPLVRGDNQTIEAHLSSLNKDTFKSIYSAFTGVFRQRESLKEIT